MPQLHSSDSFKMGERDRVDIIVIKTHSNELCRSYSINRDALHNKRIEM